MRVTVKGQVTIPKHVRKKLGIVHNSEIDFKEDNGKFYLTKNRITGTKKSKFDSFRGSATVKMTTEEIMKLTRGE